MWGVPSLSTLSAPSPAIPESVLCLDGAGCKGSFQAFLVKSPSARLQPRFDERRVATVESMSSSDRKQVRTPPSPPRRNSILSCRMLAGLEFNVTPRLRVTSTTRGNLAPEVL